MGHHGGLSWGTTDEGLRAAFERFGEVSEARVILERDTGRSRGFGFVSFSDDSVADAAVNEMNGASLDGRTIRVNVAEDRPRREGGGGGFGGGGFGGGGRGGFGGGRGGFGGGGGGGYGGGGGGGCGGGGGGRGGFGGGGYGGGGGGRGGFGGGGFGGGGGGGFGGGGGRSFGSANDAAGESGWSDDRGPRRAWDSRGDRRQKGEGESDGGARNARSGGRAGGWGDDERW